MQEVTTISTKGQVTIPAHIREELGLETGNKVRFLVDDHGSVVLFPVKGSIQDLYGILPKPKRAVSIEEMNRAVEEAAAERAKRDRLTRISSCGC